MSLLGAGPKMSGFMGMEEIHQVLGRQEEGQSPETILQMGM